MISNQWGIRLQSQNRGKAQMPDLQFYSTPLDVSGCLGYWDPSFLVSTCSTSKCHQEKMDNLFLWSPLHPNEPFMSIAYS